MTDRPKGSTKYAPVMNGLWDWKHAQKMGTAVFLFGELLDRVNKAGIVRVTYPMIREKTGVPLRTLERWMRCLKIEGYITVSGKNPMEIKIQNFRVIQKGRIPSNVAVSIPTEVAGQETPKPSNVAGTLQNVAGPDAVSSLKMDDSKPSLKYKNKREKNLSISSDSKHPKPTKKAAKTTSPDIGAAVGHYRNEYFRIRKEQPFINGTAQKTFKRLLKGDKENQNPPIQIGKLKELITAYLSQLDEKLIEKGFPVEWLPGNINGLLLKKKQPERGLVL